MAITSNWLNFTNVWYINEKSFPSTKANTVIVADFDLSTLHISEVVELFSNIDDSKKNLYIFNISHTVDLVTIKSIIESKSNIIVKTTIENKNEISKIVGLNSLNVFKMIEIEATDEMVIYANDIRFAGVDYAIIYTNNPNNTNVFRLCFVLEKNNVEFNVHDTSQFLIRNLVLFQPKILAKIENYL